MLISKTDKVSNSIQGFFLLVVKFSTQLLPLFTLVRLSKYFSFFILSSVKKHLFLQKTGIKKVLWKISRKIQLFFSLTKIVIKENECFHIVCWLIQEIRNEIFKWNCSFCAYSLNFIIIKRHFHFKTLWLHYILQKILIHIKNFLMSINLGIL